MAWPLSEVPAARKVNGSFSARAAAMTLNRDAIRSLAAEQLKLRTSRYRFAESLAEVGTALDDVRAAGRATGTLELVGGDVEQPVAHDAQLGEPVKRGG